MDNWKCVWHKWILLFVAAAVSKTSKTPPQVWAVLHGTVHSSSYTHSAVHSSTYTTEYSSKLDYQDSINWCVGTHSSTQQAVTTCGLSSLASFLKMLSSKRVCYAFCDIRDKNAVNQGFWSKTAVSSLPATKVDCLLIFWLPPLYNLLQPGIRKQHKYTSIHEYLY